MRTDSVQGRAPKAFARYIPYTGCARTGRRSAGMLANGQGGRARARSVRRARRPVGRIRSSAWAITFRKALLWPGYRRYMRACGHSWQDLSRRAPPFAVRNLARAPCEVRRLSPRRLFWQACVLSGRKGGVWTGLAQRGNAGAPGLPTAPSCRRAVVLNAARQAGLEDSEQSGCALFRSVKLECASFRSVVAASGRALSPRQMRSKGST